MSTISKKMCLIDDFGAGKTSLIRRFVDRQFSNQYLSTMGVKLSRKLLSHELPGKEPPHVLAVYSTSAKIGKAVDDIFQILAQRMIKAE